MESEYKEQKINIRGVDINYLQTGKGEHPVILIPGTLGSIWESFKPQVENLDKELFTIVAWDAPGYGKSRPPDRKFTEDFLKEDALYAYELMQALGHKTFSIIGWCNGGRIAFVMAAMYPDSIRKIVTLNANSYLLPKEVACYEFTRNTDNWPKFVFDTLIEIYGFEYLSILWVSWCDTLLDVTKKQDGDICTKYLEKIRCESLIVQGGKDRLVDISHAEFLKNKIPNAKVRVFEDGHHRLHWQYSEEFNDLVNKFLSSS